MIKIFDIICYICFLFLFGEILLYFCKESINICEESIKENKKTIYNKTVYNDVNYNENKKYKKIS